MEYWILNDKVPIKTTSREEWAKYFEEDNRRVARDIVGDYLVSTVFLGIDHSFGRSGPPILFETMIFANNGDAHNFYMERYATWEEAEAGHKRAIELVKSGKIKGDDNG